MRAAHLLLLIVACLVAQGEEPGGFTPTLGERPLFRKKSGSITGLCGAVLDDGSMLICFSSRQTLKRLDASMGGLPVPIPLETCGTIYFSTTSDGTRWSFPKPIPGQGTGWVFPPAMSLMRDGAARAVWLCQGHPRPQVVYADFKEGWGPIRRCTFDGGRLDTFPRLLGGKGLPFVEPLALGQTSNGAFRLLMRDAAGEGLFESRAEAHGFGAFSDPARLKTRAASFDDCRPFDVRISTSPGILFRDRGNGMFQARFAADKNDWRVEAIPVLKREDAAFKDAFGGWLEEVRWAFPVQSAPVPTIIADCDGAVASLALNGGKWSLPSIFAVDGAPYCAHGVWLLRKDQLFGIISDGAGGRVSAVRPIRWPPESLSVLERPASEVGPEDSAEGLDLLLPRPDRVYHVMPDEPSVQVQAAARVRPADRQPQVRWLVGDKEAATGSIAALNVAGLGTHSIVATLGQSRSDPVLVHLKPASIEVVAGFTLSPGVAGIPRDDRMDDLQGADKTLVSPGDDLEF